MKRHALALLAVCAVLAGCSQQIVYNKLDESAANEMVAALRSAGIGAQKVPKDTGYAVTAPDGDFSRAVQTLQALGLPREEFDSLGKVFKREGFVSTPLEERARLVHALSQELSRTVSSIDGVLLARVTLVMPDKHPLSEKTTPASAAVLIKHRPGLDTDAMVPKVKALVVNSVEGLPYEGVTVVTFPSDPQRFALPVVAASGTPLDRVLTLTGLAGVLALAGGGAWWWRSRRRGAARAGTGGGGLFALRRHAQDSEGTA
jgi:type III secretion protein J